VVIQVVENQVQVRALRRQHPFDDLDPTRPQQIVALAAVGGIRIRRPRDDPADTGVNDGVGAGRRPPMGATGLERDVHRRTGLRLPAERAQGVYFRVRAADRGRGAFSHDFAILDNERDADHRVRVRRAPDRARLGHGTGA